MKERWRDIPGFDGLYLISDRGRVKSVSRVIPRSGICGPLRLTGRVLKQSTNRRYNTITLWKTRNGKTKNWLQRTVHSLVWSVFVGPVPDGFELNHKNGRKTDNRLVNLEVVTRSENIKHAYALGLFPSKNGERNPSSKLTAAAVLEIRKACGPNGRLGYGELARLTKKFGVSRGAIERVKNGETWSHVDVATD